MSTETKTQGEKLAEEIQKTVFSVLQAIRTMDEKKVHEKQHPTSWAKIEILGHLTDSAINNHQRIIRAIIEPHTESNGYNQNAWVEAQRYINRDWAMVFSVWMNLNYLLLAAVREVPDAALNHTISIDGKEPITLKFLVKDYNDHLKHHLNQIIPNASFSHLI